MNMVDCSSNGMYVAGMGPLTNLVLYLLSIIALFGELFRSIHLKIFHIVTIMSQSSTNIG